MKTTLQNFAFFIVLSLCTIPLSSAQGWEYVGTPGFSGGGVDYTSFALNSADEPYVAFLDSLHLGKASVMKFNGTDWEALGTRGFSVSPVEWCSIAINDSGEPYVAFQDGSFLASQATVMKFNGTDWVYIGSPGFSAGKADFISFKFSNNDVPHISYRDFGNSEKATVMKFDGTNWIDVGTPGFSTGKAWNTSLAFNSNNEPYVAFYDNIDKSSVKKFDGTNWVNVGAPNYSGDGYGQDYISMAINSNDELYVAYSDGSYLYWGTVKKFNGSSWETVGNQGFSNEQIYYTSLAFNSNNEPIVAYSDTGQGFKLSVMKFTNTMSVQDNEVSRVSLYPNPANDLVTLADLPYGETHIKVFDITGKEVFSIKSNTAIETIDTTNFANGVYLVSIANNGNLAHKKLLVNK